MSNNGWYGVDLDGTLATYNGWKGADHIGEPIPLMVERVKQWIEQGKEVRIFTARVSHDGTQRRIEEAASAYTAISKWCETHLGRPLAITNIKDYSMVVLFDDRAIQVERNTGVLVGEGSF